MFHGCPLYRSMSYIVIMVGMCGRSFSMTNSTKVSSVRASCQYSGSSRDVSDSGSVANREAAVMLSNVSYSLNIFEIQKNPIGLP